MKIRHLIYLFLIITSTYSMANDSMGLTSQQNKIILQALGVNVIYISNNRAPANFIPDDDIEVSPFQHSLWIDNMMAEDNAGILKGMQNELKDWHDQEEYVKNWNLETTGQYYYPRSAEKVRYVEKNLLKYFDKRISGEMKNADKNSAWHKVGKARNALKPGGTVGISSKIKFKFRAKILLRQARMIVINPWIKYHVYANTDGDLRMHARKDFKKVEMHANVDYDIDDKYWQASLSKKLLKNVYGTIASVQSPSKMAFSSASDKILSFRYFKSF